MEEWALSPENLLPVYFDNRRLISAKWWENPEICCGLAKTRCKYPAFGGSLQLLRKPTETTTSSSVRVPENSLRAQQKPGVFNLRDTLWVYLEICCFRKGRDILSSPKHVAMSPVTFFFFFFFVASNYCDALKICWGFSSEFVLDCQNGLGVGQKSFKTGLKVI